MDRNTNAAEAANQQVAHNGAVGAVDATVAINGQDNKNR